VQGDYATAQTKFQELLEVDPTNKFANYNLGYIAQTVDRDNTAAAEYYEAAIEADPQYGPALYNLAIIETSKGNKARAIELYKRAITADPTDANANLNLGFLLFESGDRAGADAAFRKAIALNPALKQRIPDDQQPTG
jgi:tetratricopeptide (TPR) repeat protein